MARTCPKCHRKIPDDAPGGVCPYCMFQDAIDGDLATTGERPPNAERDIIFCLLGVQMGIVPAELLMRVGVEWVSEPGGSLAERVQIAADIPEAKVALLSDLAEAALRHRGVGGDPRSATNLDALISIGETIDDRGARRTRLGLPVALDADRRDTPALHEQPGRYTRSSEYSRGGMGRILLVHDQYLARDIALKELLPPRLHEGTTDSERATPIRRAASMVARFLREAKVTGQLEHPNIVPVYELGQRENGTFYYTMKLIRGETMAAKLRVRRTLADRLELLPNLIGLCHAIAYAHSRNVIHRDLKPSNVMVGPFGETVVIDWGLAKILGQEDPVAEDIAATLVSLHDQDSVDNFETQQGARLGTPAYMSPEQARGDIAGIDARSDVFSLGAMLYEFLTGHTPFDNQPYNSLLHLLSTTKLPRPETIAKNIPPELANICAKATSLAASDRYANAGELAADLERFVSGALVSAHTYSFAELVRRFYERNRVAVQVAAVATAVLAVVGAYSYVRIYQERNLAVAAQARAEDAHYQNGIKLAEQYLDSRNFDAVDETLSKLPETLRGWEWNYLWRASHGWTHTLKDARNIAWVPARNWFVTAGNEAPIQVYDADTFELVKSIECSFPLVTGIAVSSDGSQLAIIGAGSVGAVQSLDTGEPLYALGGHGPGSLYAVRYSADGSRMLTYAEDGTCRIWDSGDGSEVGVLAREGLRINEAAFCDGGTSVALAFSPREDSGNTPVVAIYTMPDFAVAMEMTGLLVEYNDGTRQAYIISDDSVTVWDDTSATAQRSWPRSGAIPNRSALSGNGARLAVATVDGRVTVYDTSSGEPVFENELDGPLRNVRLNENGSLLVTIPSARAMNDTTLWNLADGRRQQEFRGHTNSLIDALFAPGDDRIATVAFDSVVRIWPLDRKPASSTLANVSKTPENQALSVANGRILVNGSQGQYAEVDGASGRPVRQIAVTPELIQSTGILSPDGASAVILADSFTPAVVSVEILAPLQLFGGHDGPVMAVAYSTEGNTIVSASWDGAVIAWDPANATEHARTILAGGVTPSVLATGQNGAVAIGTEEGDIVITNEALDALAPVWSGGAAVTALAFSDDGQLVAGLRDGQLGVVDPAGRLPVQWVTSHHNTIQSIAIVESERRIFTASDYDGIGVSTWPSLVQLASLPAVAIKGVGFLPDAKACISVSHDGELRQWNGGDIATTLDTSALPSVGQPVTAFVAQGAIRAAVERSLDRGDVSFLVDDAHPFQWIGLLPGDRILDLNGIPTSDETGWRTALTRAATAPEASFYLSLRRGTVEHTYNWQLLPVEKRTQRIDVARADVKASVEGGIRQLEQDIRSLKEMVTRRMATMGIQSSNGDLPNGFYLPKVFAQDADLYRNIGLMPGDTIRAINGVDIDSFAALRAAYDEILADDASNEIIFQIGRGTLRELALTLVITQ